MPVIVVGLIRLLGLIVVSVQLFGGQHGHRQYIEKHDPDMPETRNWRWKEPIV